MKKINDINKLSDREWEELASLLSEEHKEQSDILGRFMTDDIYNTKKHWKELKEMNDNKDINVDKAWSKVYSRLNENNLITKSVPLRNGINRNSFLKIAAAVIILLSIGSALIYLNSKGILSQKTTIATTGDQKNLKIILPDGSNIFLNRNTKLTYNTNFARHGRKVSLSGEAFFDIISDDSDPFTVNAGKARIKVVGTSFNVITKNSDSQVEVFVKTGKVMLSDNSGSQNLLIDPGYIGTISTKQSEKRINVDPNILSWNTGKLVYDGQKLDVVFKDLEKNYEIEINTDDAEILNQPITTVFENQSHETIIRIICTTFNLSYVKDGNIYYLTGK
jgi:transmembrane sensor